MTPVDWDVAAIERVIPHRAPFLFVDRVHAIRPEPPALLASWWIDADHRYVVAGELPPTLVIEALAQAARILATTLTPSAERVLGSIEARSFDPAIAGARLLLAVTELRPIGEASRAVCEASCDGRLVVRAVLVAAAR